MQQFEFDSSGKVKQPTQEALSEADRSAAIIAYTDGVTASGRPYYAYLAVKPSKYREFCERTEARESIRLSDYGKIVVYGYETKPPPGVTKHMQDKYGFDEQYEARLKEEISQQRKKFSTEQEEERLLDIVAMMKAQKK